MYDIIIYIYNTIYDIIHKCIRYDIIPCMISYMISYLLYNIIHNRNSTAPRISQTALPPVRNSTDELTVYETSCRIE